MRLTVASMGGEETAALATMGALPRWNAKSGRSTCGKIRISANRKSSNNSRAQRHLESESFKAGQVSSS